MPGTNEAVSTDLPQLSDEEIHGDAIEEEEGIEGDEGEKAPEEEKPEEGDSEKPESEDEEEEKESEESEEKPKESEETIDDWDEWLGQYKDELPEGIATPDDMVDYIIAKEGEKEADPGKESEPAKPAEPAKEEKPANEKGWPSAEQIYNNEVKRGAISDDPEIRHTMKIFDRTMVDTVSPIVDYVNSMAKQINDIAGKNADLSKKARSYDYDRYKGELKGAALSTKIINSVLDKHPEMDHHQAHAYYMAMDPKRLKAYMGEFHKNEAKKDRKRFGGTAPKTLRSGKKNAGGESAPLKPASAYTDSNGKWNGDFHKLSGKDQARIENEVLRSASL